MSWPLSQDYNEAVQDPRLCFADDELRAAQVVTNALGLPMPRSGNFADVYEMRSAAGERRWAVKCFTRAVPGQRERYAAISDHLRQAQLRFTVEFRYLEQGIRVAGQWYPVLKMDWVEGLLLNEFVRNFLDRPPMLEALANLWAKLAGKLRSTGIAHGDLQHGNVLLVPGRDEKHLALRLIDYDGMYVPALARIPSGEVGHPAYQHPQRLREATYNVEVDRFPLLVIYTAIRALITGGQSLWDRFDNGENLLFCRQDFEAPTKSALFAALLKADDPEVRSLAADLIDAARLPLEQAPLLNELSAGVWPVPEPSQPVPSAAVAVATAPIVAVPVAGAVPATVALPAASGAIASSQPIGKARISSRRMSLLAGGFAAGFLAVILVGGIGLLIAVMARFPLPDDAAIVQGPEPSAVKADDEKQPILPSPEGGKESNGEQKAQNETPAIAKDDKTPKAPPREIPQAFMEPDAKNPPERPTDPKQPNKQQQHAINPDTFDLTGAQVFDDFVRIPPRQYISTGEAYSGPLEITAVARTEKNNIRLCAYGGGEVIFNWESNNRELRVHRPEGNDHDRIFTIAAVPVEPLVPNTWYQLRWRIEEQRMEVSVNGKQVFAEIAGYDLSLKRSVAIRAVDSAVDVKSLTVKSVTDSSPLITPPELPQLSNGLYVVPEVNCATHARRLTIGKKFDITRSWVLSLEFSLPDIANKMGQLLCWGDDRSGRDPVYIRQHSGDVEVAITDCRNNAMHGITCSLKRLDIGTWNKITVCYEATAPAQVSVFINDRLVRREPARVSPTVDRPMPAFLGGANLKDQRWRGKVRNVRLGNLN
jgi:hypothetical protein